MVILMGAADIRTHGLSEGDNVTLQMLSDDGVDRQVAGFAVMFF